MTGEEMERAIQFLINNQAKNSSDIMLLHETVSKMAETAAQDRVEYRALLEIHRQETREQIEAIRGQVEAYRTETREAINNLIIANEVTRDLANKVAQLAFTTN